MSSKIKWKLLQENAKLPTASRPGDIGFDICCVEDVLLEKGTTKKISTGIQLADMPGRGADGHCMFLKVEGRSGLSGKGIFPVGGIVDPTYRDEVFVCLTNNSQADYAFKAGDKIAQFVVYKVNVAGDSGIEMEVSEDVTSTIRGENGFGSSGR